MYERCGRGRRTAGARQRAGATVVVVRSTEASGSAAKRGPLITARGSQRWVSKVGQRVVGVHRDRQGRRPRGAARYWKRAAPAPTVAARRYQQQLHLGVGQLRPTPLSVMSGVRFREEPGLGSGTTSAIASVRLAAAPPCSGRSRALDRRLRPPGSRRADPGGAVDHAGDRAAADARACRHLFEVGGHRSAHALRGLPSAPPHVVTPTPLQRPGNLTGRSGCNDRLQPAT